MILVLNIQVIQQDVMLSFHAIAVYSINDVAFIPIFKYTFYMILYDVLHNLCRVLQFNKRCPF